MSKELCVLARPLRAAVGGMLLLVLAGCDAVPAPSFPANPATAEPVTPVPVVRKDIRSVVALDAVVVSTPEYPLAASRRGVVRFSAAGLPGKAVKTGAVLGTVGGAQLRVGYPGFVADRLVPDGVTVAAGVPVISLRLEGYGLTATVPAEHAYRVLTAGLSARGQIKAGPGPFDCPLVPLWDQGPGTKVLCVIPGQIRVFDGLAGLLGLTTAARSQVLTVPVGAVTSLGGTGEVWQVVDGAAVRTSVEVGITNGIDIEIISGLADGDLVLPYSPALRRPDR